MLKRWGFLALAVLNVLDRFCATLSEKPQCTLAGVWNPRPECCDGVPIHEAVDEGPRVTQGGEAFRERRPVFHGLEKAFAVNPNSCLGFVGTRPRRRVGVRFLTRSVCCGRIIWGGNVAESWSKRPSFVRSSRPTRGSRQPRPARPLFDPGPHGPYCTMDESAAALSKT